MKLAKKQGDTGYRIYELQQKNDKEMAQDSIYPLPKACCKITGVKYVDDSKKYIVEYLMCLCEK